MRQRERNKGDKKRVVTATEKERERGNIIIQTEEKGSQKDRDGESIE